MNEEPRVIDFICPKCGADEFSARAPRRRERVAALLRSAVELIFGSWGTRGGPASNLFQSSVTGAPGVPGLPQSNLAWPDPPPIPAPVDDEAIDYARPPRFWRCNGCGQEGTT